MLTVHCSRRCAFPMTHRVPANYHSVNIAHDHACARAAVALSNRLSDSRTVGKNALDELKALRGLLAIPASKERAIYPCAPRLWRVYDDLVCEKYPVTT